MWIIQEALQAEHAKNWSEARQEVLASENRRKFIVISSHVAYKVNTSEEGKKKQKARIGTHGNRDEMKDGVRKDSGTAQLSVIRLMISMDTWMSFKIGLVDFSGAHMESGQIKRNNMGDPGSWGPHCNGTEELVDRYSNYVRCSTTPLKLEDNVQWFLKRG